MDLLDLLLWFIKVSDWLALVAAGAIGYSVGLFVPTGWWSIFTAMLLSYHLFLGWLLFTTRNKMEAMRPLSYAATIHLACVVVIVSIGTGRIVVPHFDLVCCGVAILAYFERDWLFQSKKTTIPSATEPVASSAEEYREWLDHLSKEKPQTGGFGGSRKEAFEKWLRSRRSSRAGRVDK